ncbi:hypothetical protein COY07_02875 [Candidatus Peregrinibacteria bacterium CG_4_10_14_0_2_um_filter_43_11]|nr:MAG: hypothetical protein COY07_02875 [Candidatus Peregrinibacteria bacterium CG_4_10_14_0_2_um_filter_43_11]
MTKPELTSEEKLDQILKYQKRTYRWAVFRGVVSLLFFLIFIILPIIGGLYLADYLKNDMDWSKINEMKAQFENFQNFDLGELMKGFK